MNAGNVIEMNNNDEYKETNIKTYWRLIRKLIYLLCSTRPKILFVVGQLNKRNADPRLSHLKVAKRVVRYLKGKMHLDIIYSVKNSPSHRASDCHLPYGLVGYVDSNYAGDPKEQKLVMEHYFFINGAVVLW